MDDLPTLMMHGETQIKFKWVKYSNYDSSSSKRSEMKEPVKVCSADYGDRNLGALLIESD